MKCSSWGTRVIKRGTQYILLSAEKMHTNSSGQIKPKVSHTFSFVVLQRFQIITFQTQNCQKGGM